MNPEPFLRLDRVIHEKGRLPIVSLLAASPELSFTELRDTLKMTDDNLSVHLKTLQEAGYVAVTKLYQNRRPLTTCSLTPESVAISANGSGRKPAIRSSDTARIRALTGSVISVGTAGGRAALSVTPENNYRSRPGALVHIKVMPRRFGMIDVPIISRSGQLLGWS